jgi:hypothetical protein
VMVNPEVGLEDEGRRVVSESTGRAGGQWIHK